MFSSHEIVFEDGICLLKMEKLSLDNQGTYMCKATNICGVAQTEAILEIKSKLACY